VTFKEWYDTRNGKSYVDHDDALEAWNAALEQAAKECSYRVVGGRAWNEAQAKEADIVQGCVDTIRALKTQRD